MKRFLLFSLTIAITLQVFGEQISVEKAQMVATSFLKNQKSPTSKSYSQINLTLLEALSPQGININSGNRKAKSIDPYYYIFNVNGNEGFVIVSADNAALPILGYSNTRGIDINNIPPAFVKWMEGYKKQIQYIRANNIIPSEQIKSIWENIGNTKKSSTKSVAPLIQTHWDQAPLYNKLCPREFFWSNRASTGCVATAMAQIMKYHNSPTQGTGFHSYYHSNSYVTYGTQSANFAATFYDWTNMPTELTGSSSSEQVNAIATLMYHCGVSVEMNYNADGQLSSSASTNDVVNALKNYFQYDENISYIKMTDYIALYGINFLDEWKEILKAELDNNRPMQYRGSSQDGGGHSFVCDGYDENDFFHFNWGWSGQADDYYSLTALIPTETGIGAGYGDYTFGQSAIIGIKPKPGTNNLIGLYSNISIPTIYQLLPFEISVDIANYGTTNFSGDICAAIFDQTGRFCSYIEVLSNVNLSAGYYLDDVVFHNSGLALYPDKYYISLYFRTINGNWIALQKKEFNNYVEVNILSPFPTRDLRLYDSIRISSNPIIKGQPLTVTFDIANYGSTTYNGTVAVGLYDNQGTLAELIDYDDNFSLAAGYHFTNGLTFNTDEISSDLGSYMIAIMEIPDGESTGYVVTPNTYLNPLMVNISNPPPSPDMYEINNDITSAFNLPVLFSEDNLSIMSTGTNIHNSVDFDFFKLDLPTGYSYTISSRVHDSYNSGNGMIYTCDVAWNYEINSTWSEVYDDIAPNSIIAENGGVINFAIMPFFKGETGSYLLELNITRSVITSKDDLKSTDPFITMYPNPAKNSITIISDRILDSYRILDIYGRLIKNDSFGISINEINLSGIKPGVYFIQFISEELVETKKLIINE